MVDYKARPYLWIDYMAEAIETDGRYTQQWDDAEHGAKCSDECTEHRETVEELLPVCHACIGPYWHQESIIYNQ